MLGGNVTGTLCRPCTRCLGDFIGDFKGERCRNIRECAVQFERYSTLVTLTWKGFGEGYLVDDGGEVFQG